MNRELSRDFYDHILDSSENCIMEKIKVMVTGCSGFIGTHLVARLMQHEYELINIDIVPPKHDRQKKYWTLCDIKNLNTLEKIFHQFKPTHVIHLAAKANLNGKTIDDFPDNVIGTKNIITCVNRSESVNRFIHTSTQYVVMPGVAPENDEFLLPYTAYGESKAEGEKLVRQNCSKCWAILRPTNIWGPMHVFFPGELWRYIRKRYYIHPGNQPIIKYYGYIDNAIDQIITISLFANSDKIGNKVFYITDPPIDNAKWMNGFSMMLSGRPIRRVPISVWRILALIGDALNRIGIKFPISYQRLFRLTVNEVVPFERTISLCGQSSISLDEGIYRSVEWYKRSQWWDYHN
jgi:nucleoside-diphosphate-sugar epimerase